MVKGQRVRYARGAMVGQFAGWIDTVRDDGWTFIATTTMAANGNAQVRGELTSALRAETESDRQADYRAGQQRSEAMRLAREERADDALAVSL